MDMPFCNNCGAEVSEDGVFCPNCGSPLRHAEPRRLMAERREKREKGEKDEKGEKSEKREKREKTEKGGTKGSPIVGGLVLIWLGLSFYLASARFISWNHWWAYFLLGLGAILLFQSAIVFSSTGRKGAAYSPLIGGSVLMIISASWIVGVTYWWALLLVALGVFIIFSALRERERSPSP